MTEYSKTHGQIIDKIIYLQFVEPALFELLEDKMPRKVTSEHKSAWKKMINLMAKIQDEENAIKLQGR